ncbi:MAG: YafY family transcriptional regulator [Chloroflexota bacterium]|nr:YafY family transcriptional regulator [Chloroflexota bacterium]
MYFPTTRVLTILELLQSHQQMSGPELAQRLEVNIRTIRRYITMLQDLGIPVEAEHGRYGSYRLRPGFKLPPLMFTDDEVLALTLGLLVARRLNLAVAAPAVEGALAKIERVLPVNLKGQVQAVQETLVFDFSPPGVTATSEVVSLLCEAAQQCQRVKMRYQSWQAEVTERAVDLYGVVYRSGFWYAVGYCHLRQGLRVFRLDRVLAVELRNEIFSRPENFDCLAYVTSSLATMPATWRVDVLLETTLEHAQEMVPRAMATLEQEAAGIIFRCYVDNLDWIAYVLVGLDCPFIVRHPPELRDALQRLAQRVAMMAGRSE